MFNFRWRRSKPSPATTAALHGAIDGANAKAVAALLASGADPNAKNERGVTVGRSGAVQSIRIPTHRHPVTEHRPGEAAAQPSGDTAPSHAHEPESAAQSQGLRLPQPEPLVPPRKCHVPEALALLPELSPSSIDVCPVVQLDRSAKGPASAFRPATAKLRRTT